MPILYASIVNIRREVILEGFEKKFKSNYKEQVFEQFQNFMMFGRKSLELDEQCCLHYIHNGTWVIVCISKKPDVTLYEAFNFLEKLKEAIDSNLDLQGLDQQIEPEQASRYKKYGKEVSSFISQWNENPNNRDKTYLVFQDLLKVKDEMLQNLNLLNDRDLLLDQANQKAKNLDSRAKLLLKNTKKIKTKFKRRRCILWTVSITGAIIIIAGILLIMIFWFKII